MWSAVGSTGVGRLVRGCVVVGAVLGGQVGTETGNVLAEPMGGDLPGVSQAGDKRRRSLVNSQVLFRHGARLPLHADHPLVEDPVWPSPPPSFNTKITNVDVRTGVPPTGRYQDAVPTKVYQGGASSGSLTAVGIHQASTLGQELRQRYVDDLGLLSGDFSKDMASGLVYLRSTYVPRTIGSLQGVLNGLYPDLHVVTGSHAAPPTALTIFTTDRATETLIPTHISCPRLREIRKDGFRGYSACRDTSHARDHLSSTLGMPRKGWNPMLVNDINMSLVAHGKDLKELGGVEWHDELHTAIGLRALQMFVVWASGTTDEGVRLGIGRLFDEVVHRMEVAVDPSAVHASEDHHVNAPVYFPDSSHAAKLCLYSAHDTAIVMALKAMGVLDILDDWPKYCATITWELWKDDETGEHTVRVLYCGEPIKLPFARSTHCPLGTFRSNMLKLVPQDWSQECRPQWSPASGKAGSDGKVQGTTSAGIAH